MLRLCQKEKKKSQQNTIQPDYNELFPSSSSGGGGYGNGASFSSSKQYDGFGSQPYYPAPPGGGVSLNTAVAKANEAANKAKGWLSSKLANWSESLNGQGGIDQRPGGGGFGIAPTVAASSSSSSMTTNSTNPGQSFNRHPPAPSGWGGGPVNATTGVPDLRKYSTQSDENSFWNDVAPEKNKKSTKAKKSKGKTTEDEFANSVNSLASQFGGQANIDDWLN